MSIYRQSTALVLKRRSLPNQDAMIFLFTREYGKVVAIARGIKKLTSRRNPHLETGNYVDVLISTRGDYSHIQETSLISGFGQLKGTQKLQDVVFSYLFCLDRLLPQEQAEPALFERTLKFLTQVHKNPADAHTTLTVYVRLVLHQLGYIDEHTKDTELLGIFETVTGEKLPLHSI